MQVFNRLARRFHRADEGTDEVLTKQKVALQSISADCKKALTLLKSDEYVRIQEFFKAVADPYENLLFNVNTDKEVRDKAAFALNLCRQHLNAKLYFEKKLKDCEQKLRVADGEHRPPSDEELDRSLLFMR